MDDQIACKLEPESCGLKCAPETIALGQSMLWNNQMRSVRLAGLFMITAPLCGVAETIANPTIHGQVVDGCPVINGAADCQRVMATANAICREYGFRHAGTYYLRQKSPRGLQLKLSIDNQETIYRSEWAAGDFGPSFDTIECSK